jgi:hypothetical protein
MEILFFHSAGIMVFAVSPDSFGYRFFICNYCLSIRKVPMPVALPPVPHVPSI